MQPIHRETINHVISLLGANGTARDDVEDIVAAHLNDIMLARRLVDCIPEAFAMILLGHNTSVKLPNTFKAKAKNGQWRVFELSVEPIFQSALAIAADMYHAGPRDIFENVATRSALLSTVTRALNEGQSLDGGVLSGPAFIGVPAEVYLPKPKPFWRRIFS